MKKKNLFVIIASIVACVLVIAACLKSEPKEVDTYTEQNDADLIAFCKKYHVREAHLVKFVAQIEANTIDIDTTAVKQDTFVKPQPFPWPTCHGRRMIQLTDYMEEKGLTLEDVKAYIDVN